MLVQRAQVTRPASKVAGSAIAGKVPVSVIRTSGHGIRDVDHFMRARNVVRRFKIDEEDTITDDWGTPIPIIDEEPWDKVVRTVAGLRPRTIAAAAGGLVVLYASAGVLDTLDHLPLVPGVLKLVGLGASLWLWGRYLVYHPGRQELDAQLKEITARAREFAVGVDDTATQAVDSAAELGHEASRAAERAWDVLQGDPAASPASRDMGRVYDDALKAGKDAGAAARLMGRDVGRAAEDIGRRAEAGGQAVGRDVEQLGKDGGRVVRDLEEDEW